MLSILEEGDGQVEFEQAMGFNFLTVEFCPVDGFVVGKDAVSVLLKKADQLFEQKLSLLLFFVLLLRLDLLLSHDWLKRLSSHRENKYTVMNIGR